MRLNVVPVADVQPLGPGQCAVGDVARQAHRGALDDAEATGPRRPVQVSLDAGSRFGVALGQHGLPALQQVVVDDVEPAQQRLLQGPGGQLGLGQDVLAPGPLGLAEVGRDADQRQTAAAARTTRRARSLASTDGCREGGTSPWVIGLSGSDATPSITIL